LDISERKCAEEALRLSEERYALAQRAANIGSWDWNIEADALRWSDQIEPMFGFGPGEFGATYEAFLDCVHPEDRQYVVDSVRACVQSRQEYSIEHRIVWPDGTIHWVAETGNVIRDEEGQAIRMLGIVQNITRRKHAEEDREKLISELEASLAKVKTLSGLLPICASCKKIRDDGGYWTQVEVYLRNHSDAEFSHGICPECMQKLYPDYVQRDEQ
jgi:PAS domain S-box-containing protein